MVRVTAVAPPAPPRADLERIWPYVPGLHRSEIEREFGFRDVLQMVGVRPTVVPHVDWGFDLDGLREAVTERTRVLFLDDPCNPTGTAIPALELAALLDDLPPEVLVVLDRAYYEFVAPAERFEEDVERIQGGANLVVLRTFSKAYGLAGLRAGYAIARPEHAHALNRVREAFNSNVYAQAAALAALEDDAHVADTVRVVDAERPWLRGELERLGFAVQPSVTNFLFTDLGPEAGRVHHELLLRGIIVRPMSAPGIRTRARISIPARAGGERLVVALGEILA